MKRVGAGGDQGRSKVWKRRSGFRQKAAEIPRGRWFGCDFRTALGGDGHIPARRDLCSPNGLNLGCWKHKEIILYPDLA